MIGHWRLALKHAAWISVGALAISATILFVFSGSHVLAFLYGVVAALVSYVSTALTVSAFAGRSVAAGLMIGVGSFVARLVFAAVTLGVPAYLGLWPVVPMLVGFTGVYVVENVLATLTVVRSKQGV